MQTELIEGKVVFVVESHHQALEAWSQIRGEFEQAPNLITLDFHTDTHEPFDYYLYEIEVAESQREAERSRLLDGIDYTKVESLRQAIDKLKHDEHILAAIQRDIIAAAFLVIQSSATFTSVLESEKVPSDGAIARMSALQDVQLSPTEKDKSVFFAEVVCASECKKRPCDEECNKINRRQVIESASLERYLEELDSKARAAGIHLPREIPYILDIDLDCFSSMSSIEPVDSALFHKLIREAEAVTIAIERECTRYCWHDGDSLDIEALLGKVKKHIHDAMKH